MSGAVIRNEVFVRSARMLRTALGPQIAAWLDDPAVVEVFYDIRTGRSVAEEIADVQMGVAQLKPGMVLSRDLLSTEGALLLSADHVLSDRMLKQLAEYERRASTQLQLFVKSGTTDAPHSHP